jgi:aminopeptidase
MDKGDIKWVVAASASDAWAKKVFPDLEPAEALEKLWQLIFQACRIDQEDPVQAWKDHDKKLKTMENWMDSQDFEYLHYEGPGTDLKVYLAEKNKWVGGSSTTPEGITYMANIPTEEVFGTPDRNRVDGTLRATKPLSVGGKMLEGMEFEFKDGQVVSFKADTNQDVLENQMQMDEGANRLGEVALVAHSSPISKMNVVFGSTLFDENASCHFALGSSYAEAIRGGEEMSQAERMELGANKSMIHIDFMVGSDKLQVTGYKKDGSAVPVLVNGEFPEF